tara:strand:+ start:159 stop:752 length:594 start_codon:yes stop_codon:yes gene_type:complete
MIRIGIIGSIGSGKSFVAKLFKYPIFDADKEVKYLYKNSRECFRKLNKILPKHVRSFPIKKKELITSINENKKNLRKISSIVHPMIRKKMKIFLNKKKNSKIIILDIPLLIENKLNKKKDILIFVKTNRKKIIERLKKRPNFNMRIFRSLKENQFNLSKKRRIANYIIDNNYSPNIMKKKINILKKKVLNERSNIRH